MRLHVDSAHLARLKFVCLRQLAFEKSEGSVPSVFDEEVGGEEDG